MKETENRLVRSLNFFSRKKENERIEKDNLKFAKRLLEKPALIDIKSMDREFEEHLKYRKQLLRVQQKK